MSREIYRNMVRRIINETGVTTPPPGGDVEVVKPQPEPQAGRRKWKQNDTWDKMEVILPNHRAWIESFLQGVSGKLRLTSLIRMETGAYGVKLKDTSKQAKKTIPYCAIRIPFTGAWPPNQSGQLTLATTGEGGGAVGRYTVSQGIPLSDFGTVADQIVAYLSKYTPPGQAPAPGDGQAPPSKPTPMPNLPDAKDDL